MSNNRFKFRAWDKENKVLHYNAECAYDSMNGTPTLTHDSFGDLLDDEQFTIEQCTGLKDKNGKLIYEGDVVRTTANKIGVVKWVCNRCKFEVLLADNSMWLVHETQEIIGNIHEMEKSK